MVAKNTAGKKRGRAPVPADEMRLASEITTINGKLDNAKGREAQQLHTRKAAAVRELGRLRFIRIGEPRMTKCLNTIGLLGNLARGPYEFDPIDVSAMRTALVRMIDDTMALFTRGKAPKEQFKFSDAYEQAKAAAGSKPFAWSDEFKNGTDTGAAKPGKHRRK